MSLTQSEAPAIVSLESMKLELRIPPSEASQDALLSDQIHSAANFVMKSTGLALANLMPLRAAIVSLTRELYDGRGEIGSDSTVYGLMSVYRSYNVIAG